METVDPTTGEVRTVAAELVPVAKLWIHSDERTAASRFVHNINDPATPLSAIPADLAKVRELARRVRQFAADCDRAAIARMQAAGAKEATQDGVRMLLRVDRKYEYDEAELSRLADLVNAPDGLTADECSLALRRVLEPDKKLLNQLVKRGGRLREIIEAGTREVSKPKLDVEAVTR